MTFRSYKYRDVIKKVRKAGFNFRRATGGTHEIWWNEESGKTCVIPHHKEIQAGTIKSIIKQMGLDEEKFHKL